MKKILVLAVVLLCTKAANAYDRNNHGVITAQAIALLNETYGCDYICPHEAKMIINGNLSEDDPRNPKMLIRPFNQHFYNPRKEDWQWSRSGSIDVRFQRMVRRLFGRIDREKYYYSVGELVHHMQDVTNPSHVVPVYHGPGKRDIFDEQCIRCLLPHKLTVKRAAVLEHAFPEKLLNELAETTLTNLEKPFVIKKTTHGKTVNKTITWEDYWKDDNNGWWGSYGQPEQKCLHRLAGKDHYLQTHIHNGCTHYDIPYKNYENFTRQQVKLAVNYTALMIFFAKEYAKDHHKHFHHSCH
jgi:hypothetical protein